MSKAVAIGEAKTNLSKLVERAEMGEEVVIRRGDKPVAKLIRYREPGRRQLFGALEGQIVIGEDFDEPIPGLEECVDPPAD
jgi:antitoxin (DNA-binding transcriptional repressor) of toxin-antitoxin stability system